MQKQYQIRPGINSRYNSFAAILLSSGFFCFTSVLLSFSFSFSETSHAITTPYRILTGSKSFKFHLHFFIFFLLYLFLLYPLILGCSSMFFITIFQHITIFQPLKSTRNTSIIFLSTYLFTAKGDYKCINMFMADISRS